MAPTNPLRMWTAQIIEGCEIVVLQSEPLPSDPTSLQVYGPAGSVFVKPGLNLRYWYSTFNQYVTDSINLTVEYNFGAGFPAPCYPEFVDATNSIRTVGGGWSEGPIYNYEAAAPSCGTHAFQEVAHTNRATGFLNTHAIHHDAGCRQGISVLWGHDKGSTMCYIGNVEVPGTAWDVAHEVARLSREEYTVITVE